VWVMVISGTLVWRRGSGIGVMCLGYLGFPFCGLWYGLRIGRVGLRSNFTLIRKALNFRRSSSAIFLSCHFIFQPVILSRRSPFLPRMPSLLRSFRHFRPQMNLLPTSRAIELSILAPFFGG
jgi:hypothetical protein